VLRSGLRRHGPVHRRRHRRALWLGVWRPRWKVVSSVRVFDSRRRPPRPGARRWPHPRLWPLCWDVLPEHSRRASAFLALRGMALIGGRAKREDFRLLTTWRFVPIVRNPDELAHPVVNCVASAHKLFRGGHATDSADWPWPNVAFCTTKFWLTIVSGGNRLAVTVLTALSPGSLKIEKGC
jgi:hypothetical protein